MSVNEAAPTASAAMTDEQILGIGSDSQAASGEPAQDGAGVDGSGETVRSTQGDNAKGREAQDGREVGEKASGQAVRSTADEVRDAPEWMKPLLADAKVGREVQALWNEHQAYREAFPTIAEARAVKELFPGGAQEARSAMARVAEFDRIDDAYFGADARGQAQLATYLLETNPRAFENMLAAATRVLAERAPVAYRELADRLAAAAAKTDGEAARKDAPAPDTRAPSAELKASAELARERDALQRERQEFRAEQYATFQQAANDAVVDRVRQAIEQTISGALPATVPDGARRRIAADVFGEINATLQNDRALTRQVAAALRQWQFTDEVKQQVVNLIFGRAKSLIPGMAKRVVSDWTSSVLGASRAKLEKQNAATRRVDITGGGAQEARPRQPLAPKDINYREVSDEQLLEM